MSCVARVIAIGSGYVCIEIMCIFAVGNCEIITGIICTLDGGVILYLNTLSVGREMKHSNHTLGAVVVFSIHALGVNEYLRDLVAVIADLLCYHNAVNVGMSADNHRDVGMLAKELIPKLVSRIILGVVSRGVAALPRLGKSSVTLHILMCSNDNAMIRMCGNYVVCPSEHRILSAVVKAKKKVINLADLEGVVNVIYSTLLIVSRDIRKIGIVRAKVFIEHLNTVVTVTANKRVRKLTIHHSNSRLSIYPLLIGLRLGVVRMSFVHAVLGNVAKTDNVLNVHCILVIDDPLINILKKLGVLIVNGLSVANDGKAVRIVTYGLYVFLLPKELLIVSIISVTGKILKACIRILRINLVCRDKA